MVAARELLATGDLDAALAVLKQEIRKAPQSAPLRTFLFQLFCIVGEWDRALTQLAVAAELDPAALPMAETYRTLIRCEGVRAGVFTGKRTPTLFGHPLSWVPLLVEANRLLAVGAHVAAADLRDQAFDAADMVSGSVDGTQFDWFADADPRLGPVLEAIVDGTYYWIPIHNLSALTLEPPVDLRDQVWMPASFTWTNGGRAIGFIPTRYPGSTELGPALALGHRTEWHQTGPDDAGWSIGVGQRMFTTGDTDTALMDVRHLVFAAATTG